MVSIKKPDYVVYIKDLRRPIDISKIIKSLGDTGYSYSFKYRNKPIKYGKSDNFSKTPGERLYRQIANLPGWDTIPASSCGKDIITAVNSFEKEENVKVHKDECTLEIWLSVNPSEDEDELLSQYKEDNGRLPAGNVKERVKGMVSKQHLSNFFEGFE